MSRWFRMYADALRNPKVASLSDRDYRTWVGLLSVAAENDGKLPGERALKRLLMMRLDHLSSALKRLASIGLIDQLASGYEPHSWGKFQYKSDTSAERVTLHRARKLQHLVTPPDTESEEEAEEEGSVAKATVASDPVKELFDVGVSILTGAGHDQRQARSLIGKWRKGRSDGEVLSGLIDCRTRAISEPVEWLTKRFNGSSGYVSDSGYEYRGDTQAVMRQAEKRADWSTYYEAKGNL